MGVKCYNNVREKEWVSSVTIMQGRSGHVSCKVAANIDDDMHADGMRNVQ